MRSEPIPTGLSGGQTEDQAPEAGNPGLERGDRAQESRGSLTFRQTDLVLGLVLLILGLLIVYGSMGLTYSTRAGPGPGFLPRWLGIGLGLAGLGLFVSRLRTRGAGEPLDLPERRGLVRVGVTLLLLIGLALTFQPLGFLISTAAMIFILLFVLEGERPPMAVSLAVLLPLASYLFFKVWLGVKLPAGLIGF